MPHSATEWTALGSALFFVLCLAPLAAQEPTVIAGRVVDSTTNQPIAGARVVFFRDDRRNGITSSIWDTELNPPEQDPSADVLAAETASDGVFRFRVDAPAAYRFYVSRDGYVRWSTDGRSGTLKPGVPVNGLVIQLQPEASIFGRVIDEDTREPLAGIRVTAHRYERLGAAWRLMGRSSGMTDDDGVYGIDGLPPGEYYLQAQSIRSLDLKEPRPVETFAEALGSDYRPTWYPGAETSELAIAVPLAQGGRVEGTDFAIPKHATMAIRGKLLAEDPEATAEIRVERITRSWGSNSRTIIGYGEGQAGYEFEVDQLNPGMYWVYARTARGEPGALYASATVSLTGENADGIELYLRPEFDIEGQVEIEGREQPPDEPLLPNEGTLVELAPLKRQLLGGQQVAVEPEDGSFAFREDLPGSYLVLLRGLPEGLVVSSVRYNESLAENGVVTLNESPREHHLQIVLAPATGAVVASVTDGIRPSRVARVILAAESVAENPDIEIWQYLVRSASADVDGRAVIDGLLPGVYRVTAFPAGAEWRDDPNLFRYVRDGEEVRVSDGPAMVSVRTVDVP